jgi:hypothetical protein
MRAGMLLHFIGSWKFLAHWIPEVQIRKVSTFLRWDRVTNGNSHMAPCSAAPQNSPEPPPPAASKGGEGNGGPGFWFLWTRESAEK